jgi:small-conductance mechanosensitive channel
MNKKRALIGYHPQSVLQIVDRVQMEYEQEKGRLVSELAELMADNAAATERVRELTKEMSEQVDFERELSEKLLKSHLEYARTLFARAPAEKKEDGSTLELLDNNDFGQGQKQAF